MSFGSAARRRRLFLSVLIERQRIKSLLIRGPQCTTYETAARKLYIYIFLEHRQAYGSVHKSQKPSDLQMYGFKAMKDTLAASFGRSAIVSVGTGGTNCRARRKTGFFRRWKDGTSRVCRRCCVIWVMKIISGSFGSRWKKVWANF